MDGLAVETLNTLIAGGLGILGAVLGGLLGFWAAHRLQRQALEAERNRVSYAIFAGLLSVQYFLDDLLNDDSESLDQKVRRLSETDFYCRVFEDNLGNLGTLGSGEAVLLYEVYKDEAAVEAHRAAPHYTKWRETVKDWFDGDIGRSLATPVYPSEANWR